MNFREKRELRHSWLDLAPAADLVFLLLIFFAVSTTFVATTGMKINLPKTATKQFMEKQKDVTIAVDKEGRIFLDGIAITIKELAIRLKEVANTNKETLIIVKADKDTTHGNVVEVMDTAKDVGLSRLAIATIPKERKI